MCEISVCVVSKVCPSYPWQVISMAVLPYLGIIVWKLVHLSKASAGIYPYIQLGVQIRSQVYLQHCNFCLNAESLQYQQSFWLHSSILYSVLRLVIIFITHHSKYFIFKHLKGYLFLNVLQNAFQITYFLWIWVWPGLSQQFFMLLLWFFSPSVCSMEVFSVDSMSLGCALASMKICRF